MRKVPVDHVFEREQALAREIEAVATDLRLLDVADLVTFFRIGQFANIGSLVKSSIELSFKPGTLSFGLSGDVDLTWDRLPNVTLDMEFHHNDVHVYFRLALESLRAGVEIDYVFFDHPDPTAEGNTRKLVAALRDARLSPVADAASGSPMQSA